MISSDMAVLSKEPDCGMHVCASVCTCACVHIYVHVECAICLMRTVRETKALQLLKPLTYLRQTVNGTTKESVS